MIQLGEPWWWFVEGDYRKQPCFYDQATKDLFRAENGYSMHEFKSGNESIEGYEDVLYWLRDQNGKFSLMLRDAVKSKYPNSEFTVLFFPPSVIDKQRVPLMMSIVNFPKEHWKYPNLDFFMLEDYDYLIANQLEKHKETLTFVQKNLGYPVDKIHYLEGFVLNQENSQVWKAVDQAINDGFNQGFKETYVWAYAQVKRDGWKQPDIIYVNKPSGPYSTPQDITLTTDSAEKVIFTIDGSEPDLSNGITYTNPIHISQSTTLKATTVRGGIKGKTMQFDYYFPLPHALTTSIIVDGDATDWGDINSSDIGNGEIMDLSATMDNNKIYMLVRGTNMDVESNFYIDSDNNMSTGYHVWAWDKSGADYMLSNNVLYRYSGDGGNWQWEYVGEEIVSRNFQTVETAVNLADINVLSPRQIKVAFGRNYEHFVPVPGCEMSTVSTLIKQTNVRLAIGGKMISSARFYNGTLVADFGELAFTLGDMVMGVPDLRDDIIISYRRPDGGYGKVYPEIKRIDFITSN